jgi:hypothetical protein
MHNPPIGAIRGGGSRWGDSIPQAISHVRTPSRSEPPTGQIVFFWVGDMLECKTVLLSTYGRPKKNQNGPTLLRDNLRIAQKKWLNGARPGSKVDIPIFETENVRKKKILSFSHIMRNRDCPEWLVLYRESPPVALRTADEFVSLSSSSK